MSGEIAGRLASDGTVFDRNTDHYIEGIVPDSNHNPPVDLVDWTLPAYTDFDVDDRTVYFYFVIRFRITGGKVGFQTFNDSGNSPNSAVEEDTPEWTEQRFAIGGAYGFGDGVPGGGDQNTYLVNAVRTGTFGYDEGPLVLAGTSYFGGGSCQIDYLGLLVEGDSPTPPVDPDPPTGWPLYESNLTGDLGPVGQFFALT